MPEAIELLGSTLLQEDRRWAIQVIQDSLALLRHVLHPRQLVRAYLYTVQQHLDRAKQVHGPNLCQGVRVVLGDGIQTKDGNIKEKDVDALLVADMVYHPASRNCEYALVVTSDTDFVYVLRRVEDFGCRTGILAVCCEAPPRLIGACDDYHQVDSAYLVDHKMAARL
jgi:uncharacterized LabA/DUF88 family protein